MSNLSNDVAEQEVSLSALQHWLFCPRQYGLIHLERLWEENLFTAEGRLLHEKADSGHGESRSGLKVLRTVEIASEAHGLFGVADVVELRGGVPYPVEYKRGRPKFHHADEVQLCAQALCLEEMFSCSIPEGALFYGKTRRRQTIALDGKLRELTLTAAQEVRDCRTSGILPPAKYDPARCSACSLVDQCRPKVLSKNREVASWLRKAVARMDVPE